MEEFLRFTVEHYLWLLPLGFVVGAFGTLIGAGGGFVLVPLLLLLYPNENPELITSISLAAVLFTSPPSFTCAYRHCHLPSYLGDYGAGGHSGACRDGRVLSTGFVE